MWVSSWVRFTPSIKLVTTRGSRLYSWRTLMSLGFAQIWHTVDQHTCCNYKNLCRLPVRYVTFLWQFLPLCKNFSSVILLVLAVHWQLCNYSLYKPMFDTDKVNRYLKHSLHIFTNSIFLLSYEMMASVIQRKTSGNNWRVFLTVWRSLLSKQQKKIFDTWYNYLYVRLSLFVTVSFILSTSCITQNMSLTFTNVM